MQWHVWQLNKMGGHTDVARARYARRCTGGEDHHVIAVFAQSGKGRHNTCASLRHPLLFVFLYQGSCAPLYSPLLAVLLRSSFISTDGSVLLIDVINPRILPEFPASKAWSSQNPKLTNFSHAHKVYLHSVSNAIHLHKNRSLIRFPCDAGAVLPA